MQSQQQKMGGMGGIPPADRSARSIFVGNISYDVSEDEIKKILSACGQIIGFRLMYDRDTGRPKGFGFCEFTDVQHAEAAIRNFNGYELHGRQLRVDSATGSESEQQQQQQQMQQQIQVPMNPPQPVIPVTEENPYGPEPEHGKAPEVIARTVASMPPEKMFELMRSMKETVNNNPQMARQLLIENPQLAYALLQAQVVMRVVDPKVAYSMLHREQAQALSTSSVSSALQHQQQQGFQGQQQQQQTQFQQQFNMPPPPVMAVAAGQQQFHSFPPTNMGMPSVVMQQQQHPGFQPKQQPTQIQQMQQSQQIQQPTQQQQQIPSQQQMQAVQDNLDEEQQAQMLVRVLQLTDEQIRMLPPTERAQVIELRNQLRNAGATA